MQLQSQRPLQRRCPALWTFGAALIALVVLTVVAAVRMDGGACTDAGEGKRVPVGDKQNRTDRYGDPLPEEAIARLGTLRWRHESGVLCASFSPDGKVLATGAHDGSICLWEVTTGKELRRFHEAKHNILALAFSPDGNTLASTCDDYKVRTWNVVTGRQLYQLEDSGKCIAFSPDGKVVATTAQHARPFRGKDRRKGMRAIDTTIILREAATGKEIRRLECPRSMITCLSFSPDGKTLATGGVDGVFPAETFGDDDKNGAKEQPEPGPTSGVHLWDVATGKDRGTLGGTQLQVRSLAFSPNGKVLAAGDDDKTVRFWEVGTGKEVQRLDAGSARWAVS